MRAVVGNVEVRSAEAIVPADERVRPVDDEKGARPLNSLSRPRPLRVVFYNRSYYPDFGATGQLLTELCEDLVARFGYTVTVVAGMPLAAETAVKPMHWYAPVRREERNGVRILRAWGTALPNRTFTGRIANYISYFLSSILASFRVGRADVVVSLTDPPIVALPAMATASLRRARFVFLCQDVFPEVVRLLEGFQNKRVEAVLQAISKLTVRRADRIITLGDTMTRRLVSGKDADLSKIRVIHNWSDATTIVPGPKDNPFTREHGLTGKFVVMHSGNVGMSQDVDALLDVAERVRDLDDVVIVIVGEGSRKKHLQDEAIRRGLTNVLFLPYQPKARLNESFAGADMFIVSLKRGLAGYIVPSKLYGILVAGRPFVAAIESDSEAAQIARDHDCGIVVEPGDRDAIAAAVRDLHAHANRRMQMAENARAAGLIYDRARAVEAYRDVFESVVR